VADRKSLKILPAFFPRFTPGGLILFRQTILSQSPQSPQTILQTSFRNSRPLVLFYFARHNPVSHLSHLSQSPEVRRTFRTSVRRTEVRSNGRSPGRRANSLALGEIPYQNFGGWGANLSVREGQLPATGLLVRSSAWTCYN
jgi:hypothetical protein